MCRGKVKIIVLFIVLVDQTADESPSYLPSVGTVVKRSRCSRGVSGPAFDCHGAFAAPIGSYRWKKSCTVRFDGVHRTRTLTMSIISEADDNSNRNF